MFFLVRLHAQVAADWSWWTLLPASRPISIEGFRVDVEWESRRISWEPRLPSLSVSFSTSAKPCACVHTSLPPRPQQRGWRYGASLFFILFWASPVCQRFSKFLFNEIDIIFFFKFCEEVTLKLYFPTIFRASSGNCKTLLRKTASVEVVVMRSGNHQEKLRRWRHQRRKGWRHHGGACDVLGDDRWRSGTKTDDGCRDEETRRKTDSPASKLQLPVVAFFFLIRNVEHGMIF